MKYKHKKTGDIVENSCESGYYKNIYIPTGSLIPGKYVEGCSDWVEYVELDVPIGTKFTTKYTDIIYTIHGIKDDKVLLSWTNEKERYIDNYSDYTIKGVNQYFKNGIWIKYKEYPLSYNELVNGNFYVTEYDEVDQGKYTFKQGYRLWYNDKDKIIQTCHTGNFVPSNGFKEFRLATSEEIEILLPKKEYEILSFKVPGNEHWEAKARIVLLVGEYLKIKEEYK